MALSCVAALVTSARDARAQDAGRIAGVVLNPDGHHAPDSEVRILALGRLTATDGQGRFAFDNVPAGEHMVSASNPRWGEAVERITVESGETTTVLITVSLLFHVDDIIISTGPQGIQRSELLRPANVLSGTRLSDQQQPQLGEALSREVGINSTYFGPGASRPVIRGLGGDRVRVLDRGIGVGDASENSPDHAVAAEASTAIRIEVLRGPATLLYGGSAIGGVVNVIDGRIPFELPTDPISGFFEGLGGTVANEVNGKLVLTGKAGPFALHGSFLGRSTGDYNVPDSLGVLPNSAIETLRGNLGASWVGENGYFGLGYSGYGSDYGIPVGHEGEEEGGGSEEEDDVSIDLDLQRFDFAGAWRFGGFFQELRGRIGLSDYRHFELEGEAIGSRIDNDRFETRIEAQHKISDPVDGAFGFQYFDREFGAEGEEAFVDSTSTDNWAVFLYERIATFGGRLGFEVGARYESQTVRDLAMQIQRNFGDISFSGGVSWRATDPVGFYLSVSRNTKFPSAEELFSSGPHAATQQFEIGNPLLAGESSVNLDVAVQAIEGPVTGSATVFVNTFSEYIYQELTGDVQGDLPVALWTQADAKFSGFEVEADVEVFHRGTHHIVLRAWTDYVRATLTETDEPLPRIPPLRFGGGVHYDQSHWRGGVDARRTTAQDRVAENETPTAGYTMLDASVGYRFFTGAVGHDLSLVGSNLTDELARNAVSFIKEQAPLPGRDIRIVYRLSF